MPSLEIAGRIPGVLGLTSKDFQKVFSDIVSSVSELSDTSGVIELKFVGPKTMRKLNHAYAKHDYVTDVLSFTYDEQSTLVVPHDDVHLIASIIICTQKVITQSRQYKQLVRDETMLLFVHGFVHILGNDHASVLDQTRFEQLQNAIMEQNGYNSRNFSWSH